MQVSCRSFQVVVGSDDVVIAASAVVAAAVDKTLKLGVLWVVMDDEHSQDVEGKGPVAFGTAFDSTSVAASMEYRIFAYHVHPFAANVSMLASWIAESDN